MLKYLKEIYLFKEMTEEELKIIAKAGYEKHYIAGQELFFSGQKAELFYVISKGTIKIYKTTVQGDEHLLAQLSSGEHFGEMSFLTRNPRSATAQAIETSVVFEMSYTKMDEIFKQYLPISEKFHRALARFLAQRLRSTTQELINH